MIDENVELVVSVRLPCIKVTQSDFQSSVSVSHPTQTTQTDMEMCFS